MDDTPPDVAALVARIRAITEDQETLLAAAHKREVYDQNRRQLLEVADHIAHLLAMARSGERSVAEVDEMVATLRAYADLSASMAAQADILELRLFERRRRPKADRFLIQVSSIVPRKYREALVGDLYEDLNEFRQAGWTERRLRWHIVHQIVILVIVQCRSWIRWGFLAWILNKARALFSS